MTTVADPGKTMRGALNLRFSPFVEGGVAAANLIFNKGGRAPGAPLYRSATGPYVYLQKLAKNILANHYNRNDKQHDIRPKSRKQMV